MLKMNEVEAAEQVFPFRHLTEVPTTYGGPSNQAELFEQWTIGRDAWLYREEFAEELAALYQENPENAPADFLTAKKKWGATSLTCQQCHQNQARVHTVEEFNTVVLPPEEVASVGIWPEVSSSWYGTLPQD